MNSIKRFLIGIVLGVANLIPGVSGGTIAVVFNVYEKLISVITLNIKKIFEEWKFLLPLGLGIVFGIFAFSRLISFLLLNYPIQTNTFFIGLIFGSIPLLLKKVPKDKFLATKYSSSIAFTLAVACMLVMFLMSPNDSHIIHEHMNVALFLRLTLSLALAAIAMIIPGVSGSFLMMVVGIYPTVLSSISNMTISYLIPIALGVILGLLVGAQIVRVLLEKAETQTYSAILALVLMSALVIFPFNEVYEFVTEASVVSVIVLVLTSIASFAIGFFLSILTSKTEG